MEAIAKKYIYFFCNDHYLRITLCEAPKKALLFTTSLSLWMITTYVTCVKHQKRILQFIFTLSLLIQLQSSNGIMVNKYVAKKEQAGI